MHSKRYPASHYDDDLVLKVPALLWAAMAFFVRHVLFLAVGFLPRIGDALSYLQGIVEPTYLIADVLAAPVLLVALRRKPGSPVWMRAIWYRGRVLLVGSALTYLALWVANLGLDHHWHLAALDRSMIISLALNMVFLTFVATSPLVRDVFRDFPTTSGSGPGGK
ncbi:MAG: DUF2919 family protein [Gammaproteobacteria bacterium]